MQCPRPSNTRRQPRSCCCNAGFTFPGTHHTISLSFSVQQHLGRLSCYRQIPHMSERNDWNFFSAIKRNQGNVFHRNFPPVIPDPEVKVTWEDGSNCPRIQHAHFFILCAFQGSARGYWWLPSGTSLQGQVHDYKQTKKKGNTQIHAKYYFINISWNALRYSMRQILCETWCHLLVESHHSLGSCCCTTRRRRLGESRCRGLCTTWNHYLAHALAPNDRGAGRRWLSEWMLSIGSRRELKVREDNELTRDEGC